MFFMPFNILGMWLRALLSLICLGGALCLLTLWYTHRETLVTESVNLLRDQPTGVLDPVSDAGRRSQNQEVRVRVIPWEFGFNRETAFLLGGLALLAWSLGGGWIAAPRLLRRTGTDEPKTAHPEISQRLLLPDGTRIRVQTFGPANGDPVILTHGWGLDSNEWYYATRELAGKRLIVWDLPGLGESDRPADRDWSLEKLARDLDHIVALAGSKPVVLLGHSIGVMIILTYCKLFPEALGSRVRGLVLAHGTYTNPVRTTAMAALHTALQKPLLEPLCYMMVWLSPVVRVLNWLSYLNGSAHRSTERQSFSGNETRGQLDFLTRYYVAAPPDVAGRGMLAMFRYDATAVLASVGVPTLVVCGDRDRTCLPDASRYMSEKIPGARLVTLANSRHCGAFEHHEQFHAVVREFLESIPVIRGKDDDAEREADVSPASPGVPHRGF